MLDWLIPEDTKNVMTAADWLLTVLSIYFHDLGMLVTKREFAARNLSGFPLYRDNVLFAGDNGADYRAKVETMGNEEGERFLYQEFVRHTHAERIRSWITNQARERLGITKEIVTLLDELLSPFDETFREDLAIICESHHLDDLDDFKKYKVRRPYGISNEENANLQFAAILLRTTDLLHITKDRTPSTTFKIINPTDPISQEEWAKQMAVTNVRPQLGRDKDGNFNEKAPRDTIEIHARFNQQDGFFALTSYLLYVEEQLRKSFEWAKTANRTQGVRHVFPWRRIDDSNIETKGFLKETFGFNLDQPKILNLLTGHTLYNDTSVVLRELVQNSLDAVRLQKLIDSQASKTSSVGKITIEWNSKERILSVEDDGTGMTQQIIESNLLTVGASRYEDPEFKKNFPSFSAISRFGIGILSTFMIADYVEITTCHPEEEFVRQLSLRSVLGKYLIKLLDKETDNTAKSLTPHGTRVKLKIRRSAVVPDVLKTARRWIVIPNCEVYVILDSSEPIKIGFSSPQEALAGVVDNLKKRRGDNYTRHSIKEKEINGVTVAYAIEWSEYFKEWSFITFDSIYSGDIDFQVGTCIEGVRVESNTPGYNGRAIIALANATGPNTPKTNVARSGIEVTPERDMLLQSIYSVFCSHIEDEFKALYEQRNYSLTWAIREAKYLLQPLLNPSRRGLDGHENISPLDNTKLYERIKEIPLVLVEKDEQRNAISPLEFAKIPSFWIVNSPSFRHAESLIREVPSTASLSALVKLFFPSSQQLPEGVIVSDTDFLPVISDYIFSSREVDRISVKHDSRRVDYRWVGKNDPPRWRTFPRELDPAKDLISRFEGQEIRTRFNRGGYTDVMRYMVGYQEIEVSGRETESGVAGLGKVFLFSNSEVAKYLNLWLDRIQQSPNRDVLFAAYIVFSVVGDFLGYRRPRINGEEELKSYLKNYGYEQFLTERMDIIEVINLTRNTNIDIYDPTAWSRSRGGVDFNYYYDY